MPLLSVAQLTLSPIEKNTGNVPGFSSRTKSLTPMSMPFWDDFSAQANTDTLWEHKSTVWINSGMGIKPPTVNVATFDGLDENGVPYSPGSNQNLEFGITDSLVSRSIKMTEVPLFQRNSVFLSFYYQWGGFGEVPDENDFLRLEFLTNTGIWETILTLQSNDAQLSTQFYSTTIRINQDKFYHDDFKFRFRSSGRKSGRYDTWNIDYIYLNKGRTASDLNSGFPDRAPYLPMTALFEPYYAVPQRHFISNPEENTSLLTFGLSNLSSIPQPMNYDIDAFITAYTNDVKTEVVFPVAKAQPILPSITAFEKRAITFTTKPDLSPFITADSLSVIIKTTLVTGDSVNTGFEPLDFYVNDTLRHTYVLKDYYAYDDGSAEYAVGLTQSGNRAAYQFILKTSEEDTLNGLYIHYPFTSGTSALSTLFTIYTNKDGKPDAVLYEETIPVQRRANSAFILFPFTQSVLVKDTFYIGWRQPISGRVQIGLDASQNTGNHIFVNVTGAWVQNTLIEGSLMIRPRFGSGDIITALSEQPRGLSIYPNPNAGEFILRGDFTDLQIFSLTGKPMQYGSESFGEETHIQVHDAPSGIYVIRYRTNNRIFSEKIIIRK
jgi:hypothetical protein